MNPFRLIIALVLLAGVAIGLGGKFVIVCGYDFGLTYAQKEGFHLSPLFINLESTIGDPKYLKYENLDLFRKNNPKAAADLKKFLDVIQNSIVCSAEQQYLEECTKYYLDSNIYNTVHEGPLDWQKLFPYTNYIERKCPSGGRFYYYRIGSSYRVGCTVHTRQKDNKYLPYIGF